MELPEPFRAAGPHIAIELGDARAVFTTRRGGVSAGPYESLNLGLATDDEPEHVLANHRRLAASLDVTLGLCRQVHGTRLHRLTEPLPAEERPEADGQLTTVPGLAPLVTVADCLPVVVATSGAVAVLHAGWRGLAGGIVAEGVRALRELGGDGELLAAVGPGAGGCCYEVGEEVHAAFAGHGDSVRDGRRLDLKAIARRELEAAGVSAVHDVGLCTLCSDPSLFFSHRRDGGVTGRQAGVAWLS